MRSMQFKAVLFSAVVCHLATGASAQVHTNWHETDRQPGFGLDPAGLICVGDGTFQVSRNFATGPSPRSVAIGDLNGNGLSDLAIANSTSPGTVSVLLSNGDGTFQVRQDFATGDRPMSVAISDLNGDGLPDLIIANFESSSVSVLLGNGDGTFQARQDFATGIEPSSVAIGDLDGDGLPDIAVTSSGSKTSFHNP